LLKLETHLPISINKVAMLKLRPLKTVRIANEDHRFLFEATSTPRKV